MNLVIQYKFLKRGDLAKAQTTCALVVNTVNWNIFGSKFQISKQDEQNHETSGLFS